MQAEDKGWQAAFDKFSNQMRAWNLQVRSAARAAPTPLTIVPSRQIKDVAGDGNCLFRSISDQLYDGPESETPRY